MASRAKQTKKTEVANSIDLRAREMVDDCECYISDLDGINRVLVEDMLFDYFRVVVQLNDVYDKLAIEGTKIRDDKGREYKNPDVTTSHSLKSEKASLIPKIMKYIKTDDPDKGDALVEFLRNGKA